MTRQRLTEISSPSLGAALDRKMAFIDDLRHRQIAIKTDAANRQHYEVGVGIMGAAMGPALKYSCALFDNGAKTLEEAENAMLASYIEKADIKDGMKILDLG